MIEDSEDDSELVRLELERGRFHVDYERVDTREQLEPALDSNRFHVAIADFSMPHFDGLKAFELVRERQPELPFIFVSGVLGEEQAVEAMRAGAHDYVLKGNLSRLLPAVERELREAESRRRRRAAEEALAAEERRYRSIFENAAVALWEVDFSSLEARLVSREDHTRDVRSDDLARLARELKILDVNEAAVRLMGCSSRAELTKKVGELHSQEAISPWTEACRTVLQGRTSLQWETSLQTRGGEEVPVFFFMHTPETNEQLYNVVVCMLDLSERRRLEEQMRAAQRMEAIGRLAGGIAHDFNNILTVIRSHAVFALDATAENDSWAQDIHAIRDAADHASTLTRQLLAFGRRQEQTLESVDINALLENLTGMVSRLLGDDIALDISPAAELPAVRADPAQLEQVVMNLVVNARDAMPKGGHLAIETGKTELNPYQLGEESLSGSGCYVRLSITDGGVGMDEETQARAWDPFFTTKEHGKGTGLGLATIYGIVKQNGGHICLDSAPGRGTRFDVFLPPAGPSQASPEWRPRVSDELGGDENILLVEDDPLVRRSTQRALARLGYQVLVAEGGREALELCEQRDNPIDIVLTDLVMPGLSGREVAEQVERLRPTAAIVYMSGYADEDMAPRPGTEPVRRYVQKPFEPEELVRTIRQALDERGT